MRINVLVLDDVFDMGLSAVLDAFQTANELIGMAGLAIPRFEPLTQTECATTRVEVSLLSAAEPMPVSSEADALAQIRPGVDGLILQHADRRSTFLPQVWESIGEPREFLRQLKLKAGLSADFWAPDVKLSRYTVVKYSEADLP